MDPLTTQIPDGQYRVAFKKWEKGCAFGSTRWFGLFVVVEPGPYFELPILRFWNEPHGPFLARTHNLFDDYVAVIGKRPPSRGLKPSDFLKGAVVLVETTTVKGQRQRGRRIERPEDCWYSKIDRIIRLTDGCPPHLRGPAPRRSDS
jgi:hypothetical protein